MKGQSQREIERGGGRRRRQGKEKEGVCAISRAEEEKRGEREGVLLCNSRRQIGQKKWLCGMSGG